MSHDDHIEHFEAKMVEPRRLDRAKAIREERQCSAHEAISVEQYEFLTRQIQEARSLEDLKAVLQTLLNKQFTPQFRGKPAAWQWLSSEGWLTLRPERNADQLKSSGYTVRPLYAGPKESEQRCVRCGMPTRGEEALVNGKIWCHPCADNP